MTVRVLITRVMNREGGYVDHPADRGGPTNYGVTQATLSAYRGENVSKKDVKDLTEREARDIYEQNYWIEPGFSQMGHQSLHLVDAIFDAAINHGPRNAVQMLQRAIGENPDGLLGPVTLGKLNTMRDQDVMARFISQRVIFYGRLITLDPGQAAFAYGWMRRSAEFIRVIPLT